MSEDGTQPVDPLVFVVGMMRSGTSAVTGSLVQMGLVTDNEDDGNYFNPKGYFESVQLSSYSVAVLHLLNSTWYAPPPMDESSVEGPKGEMVVETARAALMSALPPGPAVWKFPQAIFTFPFWRKAAAGRPIGGVLVWRDPMESAISLWSGSRLEVPLAMAVWAELNRRALRFTAGMPMFVCSYDRVLRDPGNFVAGVERLLGHLGLEGFVDDDRRERAKAFFERSLRHQTPLPSNHPYRAMADQLRPLVDLLEGLDGVHESFVTPELPPVTDWEAERLETSIRIFRQARHDRDSQLDASLLPGMPPGDETSTSQETLRKNATFSQLWPAISGRFLGRSEVEPPAPKEPDSMLPMPVDWPRISIVTPVWRPSSKHFQRFIASAIGQTWPATELCLCDDASGDTSTTSKLRVAASLDRVKLSSHAEPLDACAAARTAYSMASGEFVAFVSPVDALRADAMERVAEAIKRYRDADVLYSDEDKIDFSVTLAPDLKPEWSPDLLLSEPYLGHLLVVRKSLLDEVGGLGTSYPDDAGYDIMLRTTEKARRIVHIPDILYHWTWTSLPSIPHPSRLGWQQPATERALRAALERRGIEAEIRPGPMEGGSFHVRRPVPPDARVSAIVVVHRHTTGTVAGLATALRKCVAAVRRTSGPYLAEVMIAVGEDFGSEVAKALDQLSGRGGVAVVDEVGPAPGWRSVYASATSAGLAASGSQLCFVHADSAPSPGWLAALLEHGGRDDIGAVGGRLVKPTGGIAHSGITVAAGGARWLAGDLDGHLPSSLRWAGLVHECSAVSSACLLTPAPLFAELGGFDPEAGGFADVDYCLRAAATGKRSLFTPMANVVHFGADSEGLSGTSPCLEGRVDPYVHPGLDIDDTTLGSLKSPEKLGYRVEENDDGTMTAVFEELRPLTA